MPATGASAPSDPRLTYLSRLEFRAAEALADVVIKGDTEAIPSRDVALNIDRYLGTFQAKSKWLSKVVFVVLELYPLLFLRPPLSRMKADDRLAFLKKHFYQRSGLTLMPRFIRAYLRAMIRMGKQLVYLGYYSDARCFESIGFVPFHDRPDTPARIKASPIQPPPPLHVIKAAEIGDGGLTGDVVVIGSGAGAAILAHELAKLGRSVLMLERGEHVDPTQFTFDEVDMISRLYRDGALQATRDFSYQVLQGSCVGGSTVVNNGVCFDLPDSVLDRWNAPSLDAGLDKSRLRESFREVRALVGIENQAGGHLNVSAPRFLDGVARLGLANPPSFAGPVDGAFHGCLGCGFCNSGCQFGKKLSMLITVLPKTQRDYGRDKLRIVSGCEVTKLETKGNRVVAAQCLLSDGRRVTVRGNTFALAAGAVSSSIVLRSSGLGGHLAGQGLTFNMATGMYGLFDDVINAYDGLQISHFLNMSPSPGYMLETFSNPPAFTALAMPGWFDDHFANMRRYNRMMTVGVLVPMEAKGTVTTGGLLGREIDFAPSPDDFQRVLAGLTKAGEVLFAAGAKVVMPTVFDYFEFRSPQELQKLPALIKDPADIMMGGGHPEGGNTISRRAELGVIGSDFRVRGADNLFLCDASVFPTASGVNPQLTVMALAHYAAPGVAAAR